MKTIKKIVPAVVALGLALNSTSAFAADNKNISNHNKSSITVENKQNQYDGETLYRGLVFGQGEVAKTLPEVWTDERIKEASKKENKEVSDAVIKAMKENDPKYFDELQKAVYSGDPIKIKSSLEKGGKLLTSSVKIVEDKKELGTGEGRCAAVTWAAYAAVAVTTVGGVTHAVLVTAGGGVVAYLYVVTEKEFWGSSRADSQSNLKQEVLIDQIATNFSK
ncbi:MULTISPECIES: sporulation delaying protein family toxin [Bacillus]|uniref:Sporulation delaying protein family toxin n=2 Tax=Bacillus cereus group TaxID=86661 RepID=A0A9X6Y7W8_BACTU|nr:MULTISPECIES: sporulation delaying protein family toxin [Bacillus]EJP85789.1 SdpC family antimicrobial peptide [Bacillus cereus VD022]EOQ59815.1 SdpC family antimicrobial peptide [Bacillus cereus TIAC219]MCU4804799.1 sporulation delaying protein family toxin [Bacillus cereus]MCU4818531.1 sporulation delaying protein family toxin [Bacillus cereus]MCU5087060.1 sporulation delaying protein family toxin [Bacillus cereus]